MRFRARAQSLWRTGVACALLCIILGACFHGSKKRPGTPPHNVLLVTASSLSRDHLSACMYARPTSTWPATEEERRQGRALSLDDLAEQGVLFADASSDAPRTFPALCSLFTGTRCAVASDAADDRPLEDEATTIAERFRAAGFRTAAFTSGYFLQSTRGLDQGFEKKDWVYRFSDVATIDQARLWLEDAEHDPAKPWFVWVHLSGCDPPHDPRALTPLPGEVQGVLDFSRLYSNPKYPGQPADGSIAYLKKLQSGEASANEMDRAQLVDLYDGEVARLAANLRTLTLALRNLDAEGTRWKDTLFVFSGLHGIQLGERGPRAWGNETLDTEVLSVPVILRHPGSLTGSRVMAEPVGIEDIAPTLCDWFALAPLAARERSQSGRSLLPLVDTYVRRDFEHRPVCAQLGGKNPSRALRNREFALVETERDGVLKTELFDRLADPREQVDIAAQNPKVCAELHALLDHTPFGATRAP